jgi:hypothetical protein
MNLKDLQKVIPAQWRVQSYSKNKASGQCVAYIDARDVMKLLDEVVGAENWQDDYKYVGDMLVAGIGIKVPNGFETVPSKQSLTNTYEWVWKWDTGSESNMEAEKGHMSDAFKRAAVKWGVGRFLYDYPIQFVKANEVKTSNNFPYPVDDSGQRIYDLTKHINSKLK